MDLACLLSKSVTTAFNWSPIFSTVRFSHLLKNNTTIMITHKNCISNINTINKCVGLVCVCVRVCNTVYMYLRVCVHPCVYMHVRMYVCVCVCTHANTDPHTAHVKLQHPVLDIHKTYRLLNM